MTTPLNTCGLCRHFDGDNDDLAKKGDGQCRRRSPSTQLLMVQARHPLTGQTAMVPQQFSVFPQVNAEKCYCSEWEPGGKGISLIELNG